MDGYTINQYTINRLKGYQRLRKLGLFPNKFMQSEYDRLLASFSWQITDDPQTVYLVDGVFEEQVVYDNFEEAMTWLEETWQDANDPDDCYITEDVMTGIEYGDLPMWDD